MSGIDDERCIALTNKGDRCSRIAKDGRFCFQHDESNETIDAPTEETTLIGTISDQISIQPERLSGVQRDVAENLEDIRSEIKDPSELITSVDFVEALTAYRKSAGKTGGEAAKGALVGGSLGSPFGPLGVAAGATAGSWYGVYRSLDDDRAIAAQTVNSPPQSASVVESTHESIVEVQPIQLAIQSALERPQTKTEWLRDTLIRDRDMDAVDEALEQLPAYRTEDGIAVYYIQDTETEQILEVMFGTPLE